MRIPIVNNKEPFYCVNDDPIEFESGESEWLEHNCFSYKWQDDTPFVLFEHVQTRQITLDQRVAGYYGYLELLGALDYVVDNLGFSTENALWIKGSGDEFEPPVIEGTPWIMKISYADRR